MDPVMYLLLCVSLVSVIVSLVVAMMAAPYFATSGFSVFGSGLIGTLMCFGLTFAVFFLLDPDPATEFEKASSRYGRTLPITGFSMLIWLPLYLFVHGKLMRKEV